LYRVTLPEPVVGEQDRWTVDVDLGVVARTWLPTRFEPESWLSASDAGLGARAELIPGGRYLYAELTASSEATLWLRDAKMRKEYAFDLSQDVAGRELKPRDSSARSEERRVGKGRRSRGA